MWTAILALAASAWVDAEHAKARLIASDAIAPGGTAHIALELVAEEGWHTYWINPGDAGMATRVEWSVPKGFTATPIAFPAPVRFEGDGVTSFGYEGRVVLPATLTAKKRAKGDAKIRATAKWLVCREICLPGEAELALAIPVKNDAAEGPPLAAIPPQVGWPAEMEGFTLVFRSPEALSGAYFFAEEAGLVDPSAAQTLTKRDDGRYSIALPRAANAKLEGKEIYGVLVSGTKSWRLTAKVKR